MFDKSSTTEVDKRDGFCCNIGSNHKKENKKKMRAIKIREMRRRGRKGEEEAEEEEQQRARVTDRRKAESWRYPNISIFLPCDE